MIIIGCDEQLPQVSILPAWYPDPWCEPTKAREKGAEDDHYRL
jgi:hypothetical protein